MQYPTYQAAGWPLGSGSVESAGHPGRRSTPQRSGHAASVGRTSTRCWCCAMRCAIESGSRLGRRRWLSDKRCAPSVGKQRANSGWTGPCGSSSSGEYECIGCLIPLLLRPSLRQLRPSPSNQPLVLALVTPGANRFSDVLLPSLLLQKRFVQKNEPHPG
jgi:hypothetical protein